MPEVISRLASPIWLNGLFVRPGSNWASKAQSRQILEISETQELINAGFLQIIGNTSGDEGTSGVGIGGGGDMLKSIYDPNNDGLIDAISWNAVQNKPATFPPSAHTHLANQITNLGNAALLATGTATGNVVTVQQNGKIDPLLQAATNINDIRLVANQAARLALTGTTPGQTLAKQTDTGISYFLNASDATVNGNWVAVGDSILTLSDITDMPVALQVFNASSSVAIARTNLGISAIGESLFTSVDGATGRSTLGLGSAATRSTGASNGDVPLIGTNNVLSAAVIPNLDAAKITTGVLSNSVIPVIPYSSLSGVPTAFIPATHTHPPNQINGLGNAAVLSTGIAPGNVVIVQPNGKIDPALQTIVSGGDGGTNSSGDMLRSIYDANNDGIVDASLWNGIQGKPTTFPPSVHTHLAAEITNLGSAALLAAGTAAGNVVTVQQNGKIDPTLLSATNINDIRLVANQTARLALTGTTPGQTLAKQTDTGVSYFLNSANATIDTSWVSIGDSTITVSDITDMPTALRTFNTSSSLAIARTNLGISPTGESIVTSVDAAGGRTALGLGTAATRNTGILNNEVPLIGVGNFLPTSVIPSLDAAKITSGTLSPAIIPNLDANKISSGTLNLSVIPSIPYSNLTNVPTAFAPSAHTHLANQITNLGSAALLPTGTAVGNVVVVQPNGKIDPLLQSATNINDIRLVANQAARLALTGTTPGATLAKQSDTGVSYFLNAADATIDANWVPVGDSIITVGDITDMSTALKIFNTSSSLAIARTNLGISSLGNTIATALTPADVRASIDAVASTPLIVNVPYAQTITINASQTVNQQGHYRIFLTGNTTISVVNGVDGQEIFIELYQDEEGNRAINFDNSVVFASNAGGTDLAFSLAGHRMDVMQLVFSTVLNNKFYSAGIRTGYSFSEWREVFSDNFNRPNGSDIGSSYIKTGNLSIDNNELIFFGNAAQARISSLSTPVMATRMSCVYRGQNLQATQFINNNTIELFTKTFFNADSTLRGTYGFKLVLNSITTGTVVLFRYSPVLPDSLEIAVASIPLSVTKNYKISLSVKTVGSSTTLKAEARNITDNIVLFSRETIDSQTFYQVPGIPTLNFSQGNNGITKIDDLLVEYANV